MSSGYRDRTLGSTPATTKLAAVETRAEKIAIFEEYGVKVADVFGESWEAHELTDDSLASYSASLVDISKNRV